MVDINCYFANLQYFDKEIKNDDFIRREIFKFKTKKDYKIIIGTATNFVSSVKLNQISTEYDNIYYTVGFSPTCLEELTDGNDINMFYLLESYFLKRCTKIVAIGECGLNFKIIKYSRDFQISMLKKQIEIAIKYFKPLYLCQENAYCETISLIEEYDTKGLWKINKVINSFKGTAKEALCYLHYGFYFGIDITILNNNLELLNAFTVIPLEKIMIGSSFLLKTQNNNTQTINFSSKISCIISKLSQIYKKKYNEIINILTENTERFFNIIYIEEDIEKNKILFKLSCDHITIIKNMYLLKEESSKNNIKTSTNSIEKNITVSNIPAKYTKNITVSKIPAKYTKNITVSKIPAKYTKNKLKI
jgi:TatD DNase family protein